MAEIVVIPRLPDDVGIYDDYPVVGKPDWWRCTDPNGTVLKPVIRCNCGVVTGIGLHHVYPNGEVKASFWHQKGTVYPQDPDGCGWHVWLKLADWTGEDIGPG